MKKEAGRVVWADAVRVLAVFFVLVIHLSAGVVMKWHATPTFNWWAANFYDSLSRASVVLFVLLSGSLLLGKNEPTTMFFFKRLSRIVLPWLCWVLLTVFFDFIFKLNLEGFQHGLKGFVRHYFVTGFWFIPLVIQLYLLVPILRALLQRVGWSVYVWISLLWAGVIGLQHIYCGASELCRIWDWPLGLQYGGFFMLGYVLSQLSIYRKEMFTALAFWGGSIIWVVLGTYIESKQQGSLSEIYYRYTTLPVLLSATSLFILVKYFFSNIHLSYQHSSLLKNFSNASFGIYLAHALCIKLVLATSLAGIFELLDSYAVVTIPLFAVVLFVLVYLIIWGMSRSKFLRYFV